MHRHVSLLLASMTALAGTAHAVGTCDASQGRTVFETKCAACHALGEHRVGPRLDRLMGRQAGKAEGFEFSAVMASSGFQWDVERLDAFVNSPQEYLPGTTMAFRGVQSKEERDALVCFVGQQ